MLPEYSGGLGEGAGSIAPRKNRVSLPAAKRARTKTSKSRELFPSSVHGDFHQAVEESIPVRSVQWFCIFLSPRADNVRLAEDLALIHTQKYSLKLPKLDPSFTLLAWPGPGVCINVYW